MENKALKKSSYLPYLDGLRAIAALYVVRHHIFLQFKFNYSGFNSIQSWSASIFFYGHYAVNFFIVLSGFCLTIPLIKADKFALSNGIITFYSRRFKRIILPYFFALLFSLLLIATLIGKKTGTHWDVSIPVSMGDIVTHLLLIQDLFSNTAAKINHAMWSISVEFRIYLLFPFLLFVWRKLGPMYALLTSILISIIIFILVNFFNNFLFTKIDDELDGINPYIILFALGMLAAHISFSTQTFIIRSIVPWLLLSFLLLVISRVLLNFPYFTPLHYSFLLDDVLFGCVSFCFLIGVCHEKGRFLQKVLSYKPLVFTGNFAYSIYLIHAPLIQVIWQYVIHPFNLTQLCAYYTLIIVGLPTIIGISYLFYLAFERPFLNNKNRPKTI